MPSMTVEQLRQELPMAQEVAYFQTGTYGPTLDSALQAVREIMESEAHHGPATPPGRAVHTEKEAAARSKLARMLNVQDDELAIATNTSRAMQQIVRGIKWQPGDEFIMSSLEHVSTYGVSHELEQQYGVTVKALDGDQDDEVFLDSLAAAVTERSRLICLSHITSPEGRILPVKQAAAIAHARGVPVVLDLAQSVGQMPVDLAGLDCDFAVGSGHKWLLGPMGTGYIYMAAEQVPLRRPNFIPDRSPWALAGTATPQPTVRSRAEIGTYNHALVVGLGQAVTVAESVGLETIQARISELTQRLRAGAAQIERARIITPLEAGKSAGITTLMFDGYRKEDMDALVERLHARQKTVVKAQWLTAPPDPVKVGMRISVAGFNTEEEVDRLLEGIEEGLRQ